MKEQKTFKQKVLQNGSYSSFITIAVIAIIIVVNLMVNALPTKYKSVDLSEEKLFSISDQTKKLVKSLDNDVRIYFVAQSGSEDSVISDLLKDYEGLSKHIKVKKIDTALNPTFANKYTTSGIVDNSLVVETDSRFKVIAYDSIYKTTKSYNENNEEVSNQSFNGESELTSAIDYVTSKELPKIYVLSGHTETALSDNLKSYIAKENMDTADLYIPSAGSIPTDCACLIINGPEKDISTEEMDMIIAYLKDGGHLLYVKNYKSVNTPNLDEISKTFGITIENSLVLEGDSSYTYQNYQNMIFPNYKSHTITDPLINNKSFCIMPNAMRLSLDNSSTDYTLTALLSTTSKGYAKSLDKQFTSLEKSSGDKSGSMVMAASSEALKPAGDQTTKMVVISSVNFLDSDVSLTVSDGNYDFVINALGWMCDHESSISIHAKNLGSSGLKVSSSAANAISVGLIGVIPAGLIICGIIIWLFRRRK